MSGIISRDGVDIQVDQAYLDEIDYSVVSEEFVRNERDSLIAETDWWATSDRTMTVEQTAYRQALRDITNQEGFPTDITWPTKP